MEPEAACSFIWLLSLIFIAEIILWYTENEFTFCKVAWFNETVSVSNKREFYIFLLTDGVISSPVHYYHIIAFEMLLQFVKAIRLVLIYENASFYHYSSAEEVFRKQ